MSMTRVKWVREIYLGWLTGTVIVIGLMYLSAWLGVPPNQTIIGMGLGLTIGYAQAKCLNNLIGNQLVWIGTTVVGLSAGFLIWDLLRPALDNLPDIFSMQISAATAALVAGALQFTQISGRKAVTLMWVPINVLAWSIAAFFVTASDLFPTSVEGVTAFILAVVLILLGGLALGVTTAPVFMRIVAENRREPDQILV